MVRMNSLMVLMWEEITISAQWWAHTCHLWRSLVRMHDMMRLIVLLVCRGMVVSEWLMLQVLWLWCEQRCHNLWVLSCCRPTYHHWRRTIWHVRLLVVPCCSQRHLSWSLLIQSIYSTIWWVVLAQAWKSCTTSSTVVLMLSVRITYLMLLYLLRILWLLLQELRRCLVWCSGNMVWVLSKWSRTWSALVLLTVSERCYWYYHRWIA